jgi:hypothetical protein
MVSRLSLFGRTPPRQVLAVSVCRQPWQTWFLLRFFTWVTFLHVVTRPLRFYLSIFLTDSKFNNSKQHPRFDRSWILCTESFIQLHVDWWNVIRYHRNLNFNEDRRSLFGQGRETERAWRKCLWWTCLPCTLSCPRELVTAALNAKKLHKTDPFTLNLDGQGKKHKLV